MSANRITVKQLREALENYPDDMCVAVVHPGEEHWSSECFIDGPNLFVMEMVEIRSGWDIPEYQDLDWDTEHILVLSDLSDEEILREWREP